MKRFLKWQYLAVLIIVFLAVAQLFKIDKINPKVSSDLDFISSKNPKNNIARMIKNQCYDCHSHETNYPWYSDYAPISWMVKSNVNEAREILNFSNWQLYSTKEKITKLQLCVEALQEEEMPVAMYVFMHEEAQYPSDSLEVLIQYFKNLEVK